MNTTHIHGVGDGAPWIADQVECILGAQGYEYSSSSTSIIWETG